MKKLYSLLLVCCVNIAFSQIIARYDFNGSAVDVSGNGHNGNTSNISNATDRFGNASGAFSFDGLSSYIDCGSMNLNSSDISISIWSQRSNFDGNWHAFLSQGTTNVDQGMHFGLTGTIVGGQQHLGFDLFNDGLFDTTGAYSNGWNHWVVTYQMSTSITKFYRNGQFTFTDTLVGPYTGTGNVFIGSTAWGGNYYDGLLDDIIIYGQLLAPYQVDSIYQSQKAPCSSFGLSSIIIDANCHGTPDGMVTVSSLSGITPFTFQWSNGQTFNPATSLSAGNYTCVATDAVGCKDSVSMFVNEPPTWNVVMTSTMTTCNGGSDGSAEVLAAGATPPYTYSWAPLNEFNSVIHGYSAGTYSCNVTDSHGCQHMDTVSIGQPAPITATATASALTVCQGQGDTLSATYTGGTAPYTYEWYDYGTSTTYTTTNDTLVLEPISTPSVVIGLTVYDMFGCYAYSSASINVNVGDAFGGHAFDASSTPLGSGKAYMFRKKTGNAGPGDTTAIMPISPGGNFGTGSLYYGEYFLKIIADTLLYPNAVGTYYGTSPNAYQWDSAVVIQHYGCAGGQDTGKNVTIIEIVPQSGPGDISGIVYSVPGYGNRIGHGGFSPLGAPLKGVDIKLGKNPGGSPAARTTTDNTGSYHFYNVPLGSYKIYVDIPNFGMDSARTVELTTADSSSNKNDYYVDSSVVHTVPHYNIGVTALLCNGDSILAGGHYQHMTGVYVDSLLAVMGGDSIITTDLTVNSLPIVTAQTTADTVCSGGSVTLTGNGALTYTWSGSVADGVVFIPGTTDTYTVTGTDINGCKDTASVRVVVQTCVGINSYNQTPKVTAYPNPATDKIIVTCSTIPQAIQVQNLAGEIVLDAVVSGNRTHVDVSKLATGVYFVKVQAGANETKYIKVVKN